jgi:hypothetical protein
LVIYYCSADCNDLFVFMEGKLAENSICASFSVLVLGYRFMSSVLVTVKNNYRIKYVRKLLQKSNIIFLFFIFYRHCL